MSVGFPLEDYDSKQKSIASSSKTRSAFGKRHGGFQHPLSIPNDTAWGSDEAIITVDQDGRKIVEFKTSGEALQAVD